LFLTVLLLWFDPVKERPSKYPRFMAPRYNAPADCIQIQRTQERIMDAIPAALEARQS